MLYTNSLLPPQVLRHGADPEPLLSSYDWERRSVSLHNAQLSVHNWREALRVPRALGLDPRAANLVASAASVLPSPVARAVTEGLLGLGLSMGGLRGPMR